MMKNKRNQLFLEQLDKKMDSMKQVGLFPIPEEGWIRAIRTALNMSLRQLGMRLHITPQSVKEMEIREKEGAVTIKTLSDVANALDMKFVYGFIPIDGSLEKMIENRAYSLAKEVVMRTSQSMKLEDQENSKTRIEKAIKERMEELKYEMPRYLWG